MKTKITIALLLLCSVVFAASAKKKASGNPVVSFDEQVYDFGAIKEADGPVTHEFTFVNTGNGNLVIKDATAQCGCTRPDWPKHPVAPGKKGKIKVTYNPAGRPGSFSKDITVRTNAKPSRIHLKIKGSVIPK